ncbi:MAG: hypothetical protein HYY31_05075 [Chloroflexi bacterium]|nr:hypothetical protein [Chloroflexota bacterium]
MTNQASTSMPFEFWKDFLQKSSDFWSKAANVTQPPDPSQLWGQFFSMWSDYWTKNFTRAPSPEMLQAGQKLWMEQLDALSQAFAKAMGNETFSAMLGKLIEQSLTWQERTASALNPQIDSALRVLNLPSRSQIDRLFDRVIGIERRLDEAEEHTREILRRLGVMASRNNAPPRESHAASRPAARRSRTSSGG